MNQTTVEKIQKTSLSPVLIPRSLDLAEHFLKLVNYWVIDDIKYQGNAAEEVSPGMRVELSVRWKGTVGGTLVIRCCPEFLSWLRENREQKSSKVCSEMEVFNEMATLYCVYLIQTFWLTDHFELGPILPRPSTARDWPAREPNATCGLLAGQNPVEIRLWMD